VSTQFSEEFVAWAKTVAVTRRAGAALRILLERGSVTTAALKDAGYDHPPRIAGDLKDAGFVIDSALVNVDGVRMSQYTLVDTMTAEGAAIRKPIPLNFRKQLFATTDHRCAACGAKFITRLLQADHRVPFRVGGDQSSFELKDFMPLCGSDNRAKSMSCENCPNWEARNVDTCKSCYWHDPDNYEHVATVDERRIALTVRGEAVARIDEIREQAALDGVTFEEALLDHLA
jgi:hypothetical protein